MRWIGVLLFLCAAPVWAQTYPVYERTTITDTADLLSDAQETALDTKLTKLRADTGIELAVLTLPSQSPYAPEQSLETFATGLFNHWGIGNASRNDGILVLVLSDDRAMRIELGAGYGRDWDRVAATVLNRSFLPNFKDDNYAVGIADGVEDVITSIALPFSDGQDAPPASNPPLIPISIIAFIGAAFIILRRKIFDLLVRLKNCPQCGRRGLIRKTQTIRTATTSRPGERETNTSCRYCDYRNQEHHAISRMNRSSGRSGFGGGRSGGGGASGRW